MYNPTKRIKGLLTALPEKDIKYAEKFFDARDFDSLRELVDSALYKIEKSLRSDSPKQEYLDVDIEKLTLLKSEIDSYMLLIDGPSTEDDYDYENDY